MSHRLTVELSDAAFAGLQRHAESIAAAPSELAARTLEHEFRNRLSENAAEQDVARKRFERHFGSVDLGYATGSDNESIDSDLAREYGNG